jgi:hypothetical protein
VSFDILGSLALVLQLDYQQGCLVLFADLFSPPLTARVVRWVDNAYLFFGLYLVSLFAVCFVFSFRQF